MMFLLHSHKVNRHAWGIKYLIYECSRNIKASESKYSKDCMIHTYTQSYLQIHTHINSARLKAWQWKQRKTVFSLEYMSLKSQDCSWQCKAKGITCTEGERWRKFRACRPYRQSVLDCSRYSEKVSLGCVIRGGVLKYSSSSSTVLTSLRIHLLGYPLYCKH